MSGDRWIKCTSRHVFIAYHLREGLRGDQEHLVCDTGCSACYNAQPHAGEDVSIVALTGAQGFTPVVNWLEGAAA